MNDGSKLMLPKHADPSSEGLVCLPTTPDWLIRLLLCLVVLRTPSFATLNVSNLTHKSFIRSSERSEDHEHEV